MKYNFNRTNKDIQTINKDFVCGNLFADQSYQRRKVWNEQDKVRLIETILMEYVMPEVFFWTAKRDPETGIASTHIVDGQQRINTIVEFINNEFSLNAKYLLNDNIKENCGNKFFNQLESDYRTIIWDYPVSVVEIDRDCSRDDIKQMFYRLNLTNYDLNQQEKRNSKDSKFGDKCEALSTYDFWKNVRLFSSADARRMKDVEYCCIIYILANEGIVDQTNGKKINDYYDDYKDEFDQDNILEDKIIKAMEIIYGLVDKTTLSFISKKAQMYTLFCMVFKMMENQDENYDLLFENFKLFVSVYSKFRNEFDINYDDELLAELYADIKKYKLASSEGVNKISNRMIRFETLYKICVEGKDDIRNRLGILDNDFAEKLRVKKSKDELEKDDVVDLEEV